MIKNERQYRITRAQAEKFARALESLPYNRDEMNGVHPRLVKAQEDALRSQLADLEGELKEYESVRAGNFSTEELRSFRDIPKALIRARIAQGITQKDLAERLGLKEQQIQRYEATEYESASLSRIKEVISALEVDVPDDTLQIGSIPSLGTLTHRIGELGLDKAFVLRRFVPRRLSAIAMGEPERAARAVASTANKIFGWSPADLAGRGALHLDASPGLVRFKVSAGADPKRLSAYTVYAHYLSLLALQAAVDHPAKPVPTDPSLVREEIISAYGSLSLEAAVRYIWGLGIPVLCLDDPGAFYGACFREDGRSVIVIKQKTPSGARWLHDILHELWHAAQEPDQPERTVLETDDMSSERRNSEEEKIASRFAGAVLLAGAGQELAEKCLSEARYDLRQLKSAVLKIAGQERVPVDILANYLAFRVSLQDENWWGAAANLQQTGQNPWATVRDIFLEQTELTRLADADREILLQALSPWDEVVVDG